MTGTPLDTARDTPHTAAAPTPSTAVSPPAMANMRQGNPPLLWR
ncbi:MAG: hypothetical protein E7K72_10290 [Roseomonas mucosa]|nr:hypothetical protein [Roseomonas mucosa]